MKIATKVGIALASTALMTAGLLTAPASADTSWGGCCTRVVAPGGR